VAWSSRDRFIGNVVRNEATSLVGGIMREMMGTKPAPEERALLYLPLEGGASALREPAKFYRGRLGREEHRSRGTSGKIDAISRTCIVVGHPPASTPPS